MATYEIQTPDGATYEIEASDDSQLQSVVQQLTGGAQQQRTYSPLEGSAGDFENAAAGAGKMIVDAGRGLMQRGAEAYKMFTPFDTLLAGLTGKERLADTLRKKEIEQRKQDAPLMGTKAGKAGYIGGALVTGAATLPFAAANTETGAAVVGGLSGATQPLTPEESALKSTATGAGLGQAGRQVGVSLQNLLAQRAAKVAARSGQAGANVAADITPGVASSDAAISGSANVGVRGGGSAFGTVGADPAAGLNQMQQSVLNRGQALGMKVTPGQATGSRALQQMEAKLESQPMTSGPFNAIKDTNAKALNRQVAAAIGEKADEVSAPVLGRAANRLGQIFDDAADDVPRQIDPQEFLSKYSAIQDELRGISTGFEDNPLVTDLVKLAEKGTADGRQLSTLASKLGKRAYKEMTTQAGDRDLGLALYQLKDYADDLLQRGMSLDKAATFQQARQQYRNLMMLTSRVGVVNPSTGNVNGRTLANVLQQKDKGGFLFDRNASGMYEAARFSQAFAPLFGDSGTATRSMLTNPVEALASIPFNLATRAYVSSPGIKLAAGAQQAVDQMSLLGGGRLGQAIAPYLGRYGGAAAAGGLLPYAAQQ